MLTDSPHTTQYVRLCRFLNMSIHNLIRKILSSLIKQNFSISRSLNIDPLKAIFATLFQFGEIITAFYTSSYGDVFNFLNIFAAFRSVSDFVSTISCCLKLVLSVDVATSNISHILLMSSKNA